MAKRISRNRLPSGISITKHLSSGEMTIDATGQGIRGEDFIRLTSEQWSDLVEYVIDRGIEPED